MLVLVVGRKILAQILQTHARTHACGFKCDVCCVFVSLYSVCARRKHTHAQTEFRSCPPRRAASAVDAVVIRSIARCASKRTPHTRIHTHKQAVCGHHQFYNENRPVSSRSLGRRTAERPRGCLGWGRLAGSSNCPPQCSRGLSRRRRRRRPTNTTTKIAHRFVLAPFISFNFVFLIAISVKFNY